MFQSVLHQTTTTTNNSKKIATNSTAKQLKNKAKKQ
jgi:hypothetical protein